MGQSLHEKSFGLQLFSPPRDQTHGLIQQSRPVYFESRLHFQTFSWGEDVISVGRDRYDVPADILLEGLVEEERYAHEVVERGIGAKALEGKPLIGKLFKVNSLRPRWW